MNWNSTFFWACMLRSNNVIHFFPLGLWRFVLPYSVDMYYCIFDAIDVYNMRFVCMGHGIALAAVGKKRVFVYLHTLYNIGPMWQTTYIRKPASWELRAIYSVLHMIFNMNDLETNWWDLTPLSVDERTKEWLGAYNIRNWPGSKVHSKHCTANADRFTIEAKWLHGGRHRW